MKIVFSDSKSQAKHELGLHDTNGADIAIEEIQRIGWLSEFRQLTGDNVWETTKQNYERWKAAFDENQKFINRFAVVTRQYGLPQVVERLEHYRDREQWRSTPESRRQSPEDYIEESKADQRVLEEHFGGSLVPCPTPEQISILEKVFIIGINLNMDDMPEQIRQGAEPVTEEDVRLHPSDIEVTKRPLDLSYSEPWDLASGHKDGIMVDDHPGEFWGAMRFRRGSFAGEEWPVYAYAVADFGDFRLIYKQ